MSNGFMRALDMHKKVMAMHELGDEASLQRDPPSRSFVFDETVVVKLAREEGFDDLVVGRVEIRVSHETVAE